MALANGKMARYEQKRQAAMAYANRVKGVRAVAESPKSTTNEMRLPPLDIRILRHVYRWMHRQVDRVGWLMGQYVRGRSLVVAHSKGLVSRKTQNARLSACSTCEYKYLYSDGHNYCRGANGGLGCGCGHYVLSRLSWTTRLKNWTCPVGKFKE